MSVRISIIVPHYRTWKMTFYAIHQLLKCKGKHQLDIYVVDNNPGDGTSDKLRFFGDKIHLVPYPLGKMQSHGIAYDFIIPYLRTELFSTIESDSFPTKEDGEWLDWIDLLAREGHASAGSLLNLSGGNFVHTAGAFYKKSVWQKAKRYVSELQYSYFPNIAMKDTFPCDLMVHESVLDQFLRAPDTLVTLSPEYVGKDEDYLVKRMCDYLPVSRGVFHNRIGNTDESLYTYAQRNAYIEGERNNILQDNKKPLIWRMGMEPGQFLNYWLLANNHSVYDIPTETIWMPGREDQQQERTVMQNGFTHLWAVTAYADASIPELQDIIDYKKNLMEELYLSIPPNERI